MGFFDSVKKGLGLATGEIELKLQPETMYVGGEIQGQLVFKALKQCKIQSLYMELIHSFPEEGHGIIEEIPDRIDVASMILVEANNTFETEFFFGIPPHVAPSLGQFRWKVRAVAVVTGGADVERTIDVNLRLSPVMAAIVNVVQQQFGFRFDEIGADGDGIWIDFDPTPPVRAHFNDLELAFDEQEHELYLWVKLTGRRGVIEEEFTIEKSRFLVGHQADAAGLQALLQPLFRI